MGSPRENFRDTYYDGSKVRIVSRQEKIIQPAQTLSEIGGIGWAAIVVVLCSRSVVEPRRRAGVAGLSDLIVSRYAAHFRRCT